MISETEGSDVSTRARDILGFSRWWQIVAGVVMMGLVSPYQYMWSSVQGPLARDLGIPLSALGAVFSLYVFFQAGSQFPAGWWRDNHGPRPMAVLAGVLAGIGYVGLTFATELWQVYLLYSLGAIGTGMVYTVAINTALKWFPDRRGITTGAGSMAFTAGSALFVPYIRFQSASGAFLSGLRTIGLLVGIGVIACALVLRDPPKDWLDDDGSKDDDEGDENEDADNDGGEDEVHRDFVDDARDEESETASEWTGIGTGRQYTWREVVRTWQFWTMYALFVGISGAGLMLTANLIPFADQFGFAALLVTLTATILPVADAIGELVVGGISDRVSRERLMTVTFSLCGIGLLSLVGTGAVGSSLGFLLALVVAAGLEGSQYTLFPSLVADYYGERHSSANYAVLYSAKILGGVFGGVVSGWLAGVAGWTPVFLVGSGLAIAAGVGAFTLRPPDDERTD